MKNKTFLIDEKSSLYKNKILYIAIYVALCILFFVFSTLCNVEVGMYGILVLSFVNMAGALEKSQQISKAAINERIYKINNYGYVFNLNKSHLSVPAALLCFVNYTVLSLTLMMVIEFFLLGWKCRNALWDEFGLYIIVYMVVGLITYLYGNYLEIHSASLFKEEPPVIEEEKRIYELNERAKESSKKYVSEEIRCDCESRHQSSWINYEYSEEKRKVHVSGFIWLVFAFMIVFWLTAPTYRQYNSHYTEEYYDVYE